MMTTNIAELEVRLTELYAQEAQALNLSKWQRALVYVEARALFSSHKAFGAWVQDYNARFSGAGKTDSKTVISMLQACVEMLTADQFIAMGYTKAAELMHKEKWAKNPVGMEELAEIAHTLSQRELRQRVKELPCLTLRGLSLEVRQLGALLSVMQNTYVFSEDRFFSPDEAILSAQLNHLRNSDEYARLLFGLDVETMFDEDAINASFKRLSLKYHPDRGGDARIQEAVNEMRDYFQDARKLHDRRVDLEKRRTL